MHQTMRKLVETKQTMDITAKRKAEQRNKATDERLYQSHCKRESSYASESEDEVDST